MSYIFILYVLFSNKYKKVHTIETGTYLRIVIFALCDKARMEDINDGRLNLM